MKKFKLDTFGCQMNVNDSELIRSILKSSGYQETKDKYDSNIILTNTCAIRENATQRIININRQYNSLKKGKLDVIIILGCVPQHSYKELQKQLPFVDLMVGPDNYRKLPDLIENVYCHKKGIVEVSQTKENYDNLYPDRTTTTTAYISIIRGCNNFCTYCVVPYTRGRERSRDIKEIINEVKLAISQGYKEVTLLGQNVNSYNSHESRFPDLLQKVADVKGVQRVKFYTSHPKDISNKLIQTISINENICNYIHLPFQAGSNNVLKNMNRGYSIEDYLEKIYMIKSIIPKVALTTDIIVGFPQETEADFNQTLKVINEVKFDNAYTFIYSQRNNTRAAKIFHDNLSYQEKQSRLARLAEMQKEIGENLLKQDIGKTYKVLIESESKKNVNQLMGRTELNRIVVFDKKENIDINDIVDVKINNSSGITLFGKVIDNEL